MNLERKLRKKRLKTQEKAEEKGKERREGELVTMKCFEQKILTRFQCRGGQVPEQSSMTKAEH